MPQNVLLGSLISITSAALSAFGMNLQSAASLCDNLINHGVLPSTMEDVQEERWYSQSIPSMGDPNIQGLSQAMIRQMSFANPSLQDTLDNVKVVKQNVHGRMVRRFSKIGREELIQAAREVGGEEEVFLTLVTPMTRWLRKCLGRGMWGIGFGIYILVQALGNSLALVFMSTVLVAPLSATNLIFNVLFSHWMLATRISRNSWIGTAFLFFGSALCGVFGGTEVERGWKDLVTLFHDNLFWIVFGGQIFLVFVLFCLALFMHSTERERTRKFVPWISTLADQWDSLLDWDNKSDETTLLLNGDVNKRLEARRERLRRRIGGIFAIVGGLAASQTLLLTKAGIDGLLSDGVNVKDGKIVTGLMVLLVLTIVEQMISLGKALDLTTPTMAVPLFFCFYTLPNLPNAIIVNYLLDGDIGYTSAQLIGTTSGMTLIVFGVIALCKS